MSRPNGAVPAWEEFWALKDVSFEIRQGERVGIIGPNGAGKSTLLKILSRITEPTEGLVGIKGRVTSLLEVGTGFNAELTGRENIFLNGAILGMSHAEIRKRFEEIVAFADVEKFLDTPVKRYSSGMYARLAFAIAAHLDSEILLVDEVLAVGDAKFRQRCLKAMHTISDTGRTVVFVSHNMAAVSFLCNRGFVLSGGRLEFSGDTHEAINVYLAPSASTPGQVRFKRRTDGTAKPVTITNARLYSDARSDGLICGQGTRCEIDYTAARDDMPIQFLVGVYDMYNTCVLFLDTNVVDLTTRSFPRCGTVRGELSGDFSLFPGRYTVNVAAMVHGELIDHVPNALEVTVHEGDFFGTGRWPRGKPLALVKQTWTAVNQ